FSLEKYRSEEAHDVVTLDKAAVLVEQEAAIVVSIPSDAAVGFVCLNRLDRGTPIVFEHPVRHSGGEGAVRLMVDLDEFEWQVLLERIDDRARPAVSGIDDDLELLELAHVEV